MSPATKWESHCPDCGEELPAGAKVCPACGSDFRERRREERTQPESDLPLTFVPPSLRETVRNFDEAAEAEVASGFLRAQGIPAELSSGMIPGLAYNIALWVPRDYLDTARRLLDEADAATTTGETEGD